MATTKKSGSKAPDGLTGTDKDKLTSLADNSVSAGEMKGKRAGNSPLSASDDTEAQVEEESAETKKEEDQSTHGRLSRSGYVLNEDQNTGRRWVGVPWQLDEAEKNKDHIVRVTPIAEVRPWTGLQVRPKNGEPFAVPEVAKDITPEYWLGLMVPETTVHFIV